MTKKKKKLYALAKKYHRRPSRDHMDIDYEDKLSQDEKEWLDKFLQEYYRNTFHNDGEDLHPHGSDLRRQCYAAENARNRDIWTKRQQLEFSENDDGEDK